MQLLHVEDVENDLVLSKDKAMIDTLVKWLLLTTFEAILYKNRKCLRIILCRQQWVPGRSQTQGTEERLEMQCTNKSKQLILLQSDQSPIIVENPQESLIQTGKKSTTII